MSEVAERTDYRDLILREFRRRCETDVRYSLRSFSKELQLPATRLSDILNRRSGLSLGYARKIAPMLNLTDRESDLFLTLVESEHGRSYAVKRMARAKLKKIKEGPDRVLAEDEFAVISNWWHFAVFNLVCAHERSEPEFYARLLAIEASQVSESFELLIRLKMIENQNGRLLPLGKFVATTTDKISEGIRMYHRQMLAKATQAIEVVPVDERDYSSLNFMLAAADIQEIKETLKNFRRNLNAQFSANRAGRLYALNCQLFPLEKAHIESAPPK
ncbi:MAG: hypothetical protein OM95_01610 [Bdellovibrio sp. ArHS]|uniref:TIGR02147 family protein n=1 Tax=Bdellovibrio sp. ArHS TaxID=1569284 RepID=UPI000583260B|nr:TIGR02147 family protein [Bdellovibrio sp. ArHS]KHD89794.1 MAG: hypothetical protein OM95_01610 [Bdellovibrio sp. ArHS]